MSDMIPLGAFWKRTAKSTGKDFLSGTLDRRDGARAIEVLQQGGGMVIFKNENKKGERDPDWRLYVTPPNAGVGGGRGGEDPRDRTRSQSGPPDDTPGTHPAPTSGGGDWRDRRRS